VRVTLVGLLEFSLSDKQKRDRSADDEDGHTANDTADNGPDRGFAFLVALYQIRLV
jgi:hypothetical protein